MVSYTISNFFNPMNQKRFVSIAFIILIVLIVTVAVVAGGFIKTSTPPQRSTDSSHQAPLPSKKGYGILEGKVLLCPSPNCAAGQGQEEPPQPGAEIGQDTVGPPRQIVLKDLPQITPDGSIIAAPPPRTGLSEEEYRALKEHARQLGGQLAPELIIYTDDRSTIVARAYLRGDGTYHFELPVGTYAVDIDSNAGSSKDLPHQVSIKDGETVRLDFRIDTGIR